MKTALLVYWDQIAPEWFRLLDNTEDQRVYGTVRKSLNGSHWECFKNYNDGFACTSRPWPFTTAATRELAMAKVEGIHNLPVCYGPLRAGPPLPPNRRI